MLSEEEKRRLFKEMCDIISDHSEDAYCARWLDGIEFTTLTWLEELEAGAYDEIGRFGISTKMPLARLQRLRDIARDTGCFPMWSEKTESNWWDGDGQGPMPFTLDEVRKGRDDYRAYWDKIVLEGKWGIKKRDY